MDKEILTTFEAAKYCHVHPGTIKNWIRNEHLKAFKTPGGHRRIYKRDLDRFLKENNIPVLGEKNSRKYKVLIIDKDFRVREQITRTLLRDNDRYEIIGSDNAFEAGELLITYKPDIILLDTAMEGIETSVVCKRIKYSKHLVNEPKIVLLSTESSSSTDFTLLKEELADLQMNKPLQYEKLNFELDILFGARPAVV